ncbi:MAG: hypothetical protein COA78_14105 [Blastopirellula sp.]|nr:MAG: hypothetical protein COA78_14105 [Blastopirellula sp.]
MPLAAVAVLANFYLWVIPSADHPYYLVVFIEPGVTFGARGGMVFLVYILHCNRHQLPAVGAAVMFTFLFHTELPW